MRTKSFVNRGTFVIIILFLTLMASAIAYAQTELRSPLTRHVREVTLHGQAPWMGHLREDQSMRLVLILPLRDQTGLDSLLVDLYDPASPSYRQFLTVEEFTARFGPTQEDYETVTRFAEANGFRVVGTSRNRLNLDVTGSVASIEKAFHLTMGVYQHPTENRTFFAPDREPTTDMAVQLWHIAGLDNYSIPRPVLVRRDTSVRSNATTGSGPGASFLGSDMRAAYYSGTALTGAGQSLGLLEFLGTDLADLNTYYANVHQTNSVPITLKSVDSQSTSCTDNAAGGNCDDTEQTLDMTQALGMAPGLSSLVMYIGTGGISGQSIDDAGVLNAMATAKPLNAQLSSSWTWGPSDPNTDNPYFEEFAAQGQNFFQASGDCAEWTTATLEGGCAPKHFPSVYPADDPYVTSVGGTDLETSGAGEAWSSETAWADSGGGISPSPDDFAIPSWQTATASGCSACSKTYRNGPDVSANANYTFYVCADQTTCTENYWGGTSFAAPMWAGYMALINQQAVAYGDKALGFINPSLYTIALGSGYDTAFHDITSGSNGLSATTGYDLVTGWGSPIGSGLISALLPSNFTISASPSSQAVKGSGSTSYTVTISSQNGFNGSVTLALSGQPAGVTGTFSTNPVTGGSGTSTLNITVAASTAPGVYTLTIKGTAGALVHSTTVTLSTVGSISLSPSSVSLHAVMPGGNCGPGCTPSGFAQDVTLTNNSQDAISFASSSFSSSNGEFGVMVNGSIVVLGLTANCPVSPSTLAAGKSCTAIAYTNETTAGSYSGSVTVTGTTVTTPGINISTTMLISATVTVQ